MQARDTVPAPVMDAAPSGVWLDSGHGGNGNGRSQHVDVSHSTFVPSLLNQHFAFMEELLETQELVMGALFAAPAVGSISAPAPIDVEPVAGNGHGYLHAPALTASAPDAVIEEMVAPAAAAFPDRIARPAVDEVAVAPALQVIARVEAPAVDVSAALLAIVSERTGYPPEMLGLDLDMEATAADVGRCGTG
jgi:hypothetical protein